MKPSTLFISLAVVLPLHIARAAMTLSLSLLSARKAIASKDPEEGGPAARP